LWWPVFRAWVFVTGAGQGGGFLCRVFGGYFFPRVFLRSEMSLLRMVDLLRLFQQYFDVEPIAAPQALYVPADREVSAKDRSGAYFQSPTGVRQICWY
jgi:hypothetical protein